MSRRDFECECACRDLLIRGVVPTVTQLGALGFGNGRSISGRFQKVRVRVLAEFGYVKNDDINRWVLAVAT